MKKHKPYQFILVLKNIDEKTVDLEDSLYEAGCDDALINYRNGGVYLEFDREAHSLEDAVVSAIKNVRSASIDAEVASVAPENLVTESEIAKRLNLGRQTVSLWIKGERREGFPTPIMRLSEKSPLWQWNEVVIWLFKNNIIKDKKIVDDALFFSNINAALDELDKKTRDIRHHLLERIAM
jgi:hypothetical protein